MVLDETCDFCAHTVTLFFICLWLGVGLFSFVLLVTWWVLIDFENLNPVLHGKVLPTIWLSQVPRVFGFLLVEVLFCILGAWVFPSLKEINSYFHRVFMWDFWYNSQGCFVFVQYLILQFIVFIGGFNSTKVVFIFVQSLLILICPILKSAYLSAVDAMSLHAFSRNGWTFSKVFFFLLSILFQKESISLFCFESWT